MILNSDILEYTLTSDSTTITMPAVDFAPTDEALRVRAAHLREMVDLH